MIRATDTHPAARAAAIGTIDASGQPGMGSIGAGRRLAFCAVAAAITLLSALWASSASATSLPDGRAYEMVSPPEKHGGDVVAESQRTRAAADGSAVSFLSLAAFGETDGTGVATEYLSTRSDDKAPGTNGWATHSISPLQQPLTINALSAGFEPRYEGDFTPDLDSGIFMAWRPLTPDFGVDGVVNLYRRDNLRLSGRGSNQLLTACPLCVASREALPVLPASLSASLMRPYLAWASTDLDHVIFESRVNLTSDAPAYASGCNPRAMRFGCRTHLYEWDKGVLRIAGILPDGSVADVSYAGQSAGARGTNFRVPHTVSDGTDGHTRIFFTQPTDLDGLTSSEVPSSAQEQLNGRPSGKLFVRTDHSKTEQLNLSERPAQDTFQPAALLDASADGTRAFFISREALTRDAPVGSGAKLYMYDASKPGTAPDNLTFLTPDEEPGPYGTDGGEVQGMIGASADGHAVYLVAAGQLIRGQPLLDGAPGIYLWRDGQLTYVGRAPDASAQSEIVSTGANMLAPSQARVTPDGKHLLFSSIDGAGLTGYDHGACTGGLGFGCRELYVYSADSNQLRCASCNPSGQAATAMATISARVNQGGTQAIWRTNRSISDDGSRVFFSTAEALVPEDVNGQSDAYQFDVDTGAVHLLSSGTNTAGSWFLDASASGRDAFIVTRERLVGWDVDSAYDLYDARVGGGFPDPTTTPPTCSGDACQGAGSPGPGAPPFGSAVFGGRGNVVEGDRAAISGVRSLSAADRSTLAKGGKARLRLTVNGPGKVTLTATAKVGKNERRVASSTSTVKKAGAVSIAFALSKTGLAELRRQRSLTVRLAVRFRDARQKVVSVTLRAAASKKGGRS